MIAIKENRFNLRRNRSWIYVAIIVFIFIGLLTFLTSNIYLDKEEKIFHTDLNSTISLSSVDNLTLYDWVYDSNKNNMVVVLKIDSDDKKYDFKAVAKSNPNIQLPIEKVYQDGENYVLKIKKLSPQWGAVALDVLQKNDDMDSVNIDENTNNAFENDDEELSESIATTLYADQRKIETNENFETKSNTDYSLKFISIDKKEVAKNIKNYQASVKKEKQNINELNNEIDDLNEGKEYQTAVEKAETDSKIASLQTEIDNKKENIDNINLEIKNGKDKLKKLEEKRKDLKN